MSQEEEYVRVQKEKTTGGFVIEVGDDGEILSIRSASGNRTIRKGQKVTSKNVTGLSDGTRGRVTAIFRPYEQGRGSDVFDILFEGQRHPHFVGFNAIAISVEQ